MTKIILPHTPFQTAVLFLVFNRPDTTKQVFEAIRKAKPARLYVSGDGARVGRAGEVERVEEVRKIATAVDWPCEVKTLFRDMNLGCKKAVSSGIDWFFVHEEQGIILEDDCLPHHDFFTFCDSLLNRYKADDRIWAITGNNFQHGRIRGDASYYFSRYSLIWGWASWRRAWIKRDMNIQFWPSWKMSDEWRGWLPDNVERKYWEKIFDKIYLNEIDTWDYPWIASVWFGGGLTATPNVNLVSNIGFGVDATHTLSKQDKHAELPTKAIGELKILKDVEVNSLADRWVFDSHFNGGELRFPNKYIGLPRRIFRRLFRILQSLFKGC